MVGRLHATVARTPIRSVALLVVVLSLVAATAATAATAGTSTSVSIYTPFTASGKPAGQVTKTVSGSCFTGSISVDHQGAWRCMSGNLLYDPCFSSTKAKGIVLCPAPGPWTDSTVEIKLTKGLPTKSANKGKPSTSGSPWAIVTTSGWKCEFITGATTIVNGKRLSYFCKGTKNGLWGAPSRKSQPWTIFAALPQAKTLTKKVAIRSAWF